MNWSRARWTEVADHVEHIVKVAGVDHVGIGADFGSLDDAPERSRGRVEAIPT
jgi:membrane dipeptidase